MKINNYLTGKRVALLVRKDIYMEKKFIAIISVTITLLIFISSFLSATSRNNPNFHTSFFTFILYTIGIAITSKIFSDMHSLKKNHFWYMLPASDLEKTISKFILSAVIWPIGLLILYSVISLLTGSINRTIFGYSNNPILPISYGIWIRIGNYILIQSLFFYGAALFKRHQLIKMGISILLFTLLLFIIAMIIFRSVVGENPGHFSFHQFYQWGNSYSHSFNMSIDTENLRRVLEIIKRALKIFYLFLMAPIFWILTYLKVRKNEASNGV
ncbi:MAG: hypothetical protein DRP84_09735 [Spirochaetes bacterium]|nr:MAG: hypothetical protein DRP84_09735 [Spirochaetota bacterium]RKY01418.1 MAG: hypothetical protein DRP55_04315 [Spirochaetota bacterium]